MNFPTLGGLYNDELQAFKSLHPTPPSWVTQQQQLGQNASPEGLQHFTVPQRSVQVDLD
jgi:hypothetical protein